MFDNQARPCLFLAVKLENMESAPNY